MITAEVALAKRGIVLHLHSPALLRLHSNSTGTSTSCFFQQPVPDVMAALKLYYDTLQRKLEEAIGDCTDPTRLYKLQYQYMPARELIVLSQYGRSTTVYEEEKHRTLAGKILTSFNKDHPDEKESKDKAPPHQLGWAVRLFKKPHGGCRVRWWPFWRALKVLVQRAPNMDSAIGTVETREYLRTVGLSTPPLPLSICIL